MKTIEDTMTTTRLITGTTVTTKLGPPSSSSSSREINPRMNQVIIIIMSGETQFTCITQSICKRKLE